MNSQAICRSLAVLMLVLLGTSCSPQKSQAVTTGSSNQSQGGDNGHIKVPEAPNYKDRLSGVKDLGRRERCIEILDQVLDLKKQSDASKDDATKQRLKKQALNLYEKAGGLYESLQEDVDNIDKRLWDREFGSLEAAWQKKTRKIKRWAFR